MPAPPLFSVLVPVYNHACYVGVALDSLVAQTDPDWEAVVVNDGSTDETPAIIESYARRDQRIRVFHKSNGGVGSALNCGLREGRGEWVCWLSSDDMFDPGKLEIHRSAIARHPRCSFYFSHYREFDEDNGQTREPDFWTPIPERSWQVVDMLRSNFIPGNSICVRREAFLEAGLFDETLRYGQDYDAFLRLLALYPAEFIPERTCVTRLHAAQGSRVFPDACFFDSAKAAIRFLNTHRFEELFPCLDLGDASAAHAALERALQVATHPRHFLYALGPHPALIARIFEWLAQGSALGVNGGRKLVQRAALQAARRYEGTPFGLMWKAAAGLSRVAGSGSRYQMVEADQVGANQYGYLRSREASQAEPLHHYLDRFGRGPLSDASPEAGTLARETVFVCQKNAIFGVDTFGTMRATLEVAKQLMRRGNPVLLAGLGDMGLGLFEGVPVMAVPENRSLAKAVAHLGTVDTLVGVSRGDILRMGCAKRFLVYQHGNHPPQGTRVGTLRRMRVPTVCVSHAAAKIQIQLGLREAQIHVVPNGYDHKIFHDGIRAEERVPHRLVFAGTICAYKGVDIALRAFALLKPRFSGAVFDLYGGCVQWNERESQGMKTGWLKPDGLPDWPRLEQELPGCRYRGEVGQAALADAFRSSGLLLMPSRIAETFGLVSIEAQACGCLPVLPKGPSGFAETLDDGRTGYLYQPNDPENLASMVANLWERGIPLDEQRRQAAEWVKSRFCWRRTGDQFNAVLDAIDPLQPIRTDVIRAWLRAREVSARYLVRHVPGAWRLDILQREL